MSECCASIAYCRETSENDASDGIAEIAESVGCCGYGDVERMEVAYSRPCLRLLDTAAVVAQLGCTTDGVERLVYRLQEQEHMD